VGRAPRKHLLAVSILTTEPATPTS